MGDGPLGLNYFETPDYSDAARSIQQRIEDGAGRVDIQGTTTVAQAMEVVLPPEEALSAESLFAYLRTNLRHLDTQIRSGLEALEGNRDRIRQATDVLNRLRADSEYSRTMTREDGGADNGIAMTPEKVKEYVDLLVDAGVSEENAQNMVEGWGGYANTENFKAAIDSVNDSIGQMNSENEYQMLQLNELMSKRSNVLQLVSKIMGNMNETAQSIIQNMR